MEETNYGWVGKFPVFVATPSESILTSLRRRFLDVSEEQVNAWRQSIQPLQSEVQELINADQGAKDCATILEYELPLESRRPDVLFLISGAVIVLELKGKMIPTQADLDQASAYARDLRCYHRDCENTAVYAILVPMRVKGYQGMESGVHICGPDALDELIRKLDAPRTISPIDPTRFVDVDAYQPLPTLVKAARDLFLRQPLPWIKRARAFTDPALEYISSVIHEAHKTKTRRLVLLTGVPGSGKTLVGMQIVHAGFLDDLAVPRESGKWSAPAIFLSGNGPLVEVLQYQLRQAGVGGDGKVFVRGVKNYMKMYNNNKKTPPQHVLVFDEAQRAWDAEYVAEKHKGEISESEPEAFVGFANRVPEWCVIVGLIGSGQEIYRGEESGLVQWHNAIAKTSKKSEWTVHVPGKLKDTFHAEEVNCEISESLDLVYSLRHHGAVVLHEWVAGLVGGVPAEDLRLVAEEVAKEAMHLRVTRDFEVARQYLRDRYAGSSVARYGILTSSRDKSLELRPVRVPRFGEHNWKGPWFTDGPESPASCCRLDTAISEFDCQGLELEGALVIWGEDFLWEDGKWSDRRAKRYKNPKGIKSSINLRMNAYRVLLTRARDVTVVWVPNEEMFNETYQRLKNCGAKEI